MGQQGDYLLDCFFHTLKFQKIVLLNFSPSIFQTETVEEPIDEDAEAAEEPEKEADEEEAEVEEEEEDKDKPKTKKVRMSLKYLIVFYKITKR